MGPAHRASTVIERSSLLIGVLAAVFAAAASAATGPIEPRHYTGADQALARSIVLKRTDLNAAVAWQGGSVAPDTTPSPTCPNFDPKVSDLVITGDAEAKFSYPTAGVVLDSEAQILRSANMVRLDWQRSLEPPTMLPCLRSLLRKQLPAGEKFVSLTRLAVPHLATYSAGIRIVLDVRGKVRVMLDSLYFGSGRTELSLTTTARYKSAASTLAAELTLAQAIVHRLPSQSSGPPA